MTLPNGEAGVDYTLWGVTGDPTGGDTTPADLVQWTQSFVSDALKAQYVGTRGSGISVWTSDSGPLGLIFGGITGGLPGLIADLVERLLGLTGLGPAMDDILGAVEQVPILGDIVTAIIGPHGTSTGLLGDLSAFFVDFLGIFGTPTGLGTGTPALPSLSSIPILGPIIAAITGSHTTDLSAWFTDLLSLLGNPTGLASGSFNPIAAAETFVADILNPTAWFTDLLGLFGNPTGLGTGSPTLPGFASIPILGPIIAEITGSGTTNLGTWFTDLLGIFGTPTGLGTGSPTVSSTPTAIPLFGGLFSGSVFHTGLIPDITKTMSTDMQAIIDNFHQAINGGSSTGNTVASVKTNLQLMLTNLFGTSTLGTVLQTAAVPNVTKAMSTDMQSIIDGLHQAINGGSSTGNTTASVKTNLQALMSSLYGSSAMGTTVQTSALPHISIGGTFDSIENHIQATVDNAVQALFGGGGSLYATTDLNAGLTAIPQANIVGYTPAVSGVVYGATGAGATSVTAGTTTKSISWSHTPAAGDDYVIAFVATYCGTTSGISKSVIYGGAAMSYLGSSPSIYSYGLIDVYGKAITPGAGAQTISVTYSKSSTGWSLMMGNSVSYSGWSGTGTATTNIGSGSPPAALTMSSATNDRPVQAFLSIPTSGTTKTLGSYTQTQRYNLASQYNSSAGVVAAFLVGDAAGASSVSFGATITPTPALGDLWTAIGVDLKP